MEYAGAIEVHPPFRGDEGEWLAHAGWVATRDGRTIRPRGDAELDDCVQGLRDLVGLDAGMRVYEGAVAAYDPMTRELVTVSTRAGRVTRRTLRKPRHLVSRDNVIELATHHRTISRALST
jgi:hypothetical protein